MEGSTVDSAHLSLEWYMASTSASVGVCSEAFCINLNLFTVPDILEPSDIFFVGFTISMRFSWTTNTAHETSNSLRS